MGAKARPGGVPSCDRRQSNISRTVAAFGLAVIAAAAIFAARPAAQSAQTNINVLPVLTDSDGKVITPSTDPDAPFKGDYYLQRQVEPTLAVSTRNPNHLVAFFNDYRAVDISYDTGIGEPSA